MKKTGLILSLFLLFSVSGYTQTLDKLFKKYADDERFEYTSIGKGILGLFSVFTDYSEITDGAMEKISGIKVLTLDADSLNIDLSKKFSSEIDKIIAKGKFETTIEKRGKSDRTYVYKRIDKNSNADMVILSTDYKGQTLIWIKGKANPDDFFEDTTE